MLRNSRKLIIDVALSPPNGLQVDVATHPHTLDNLVIEDPYLTVGKALEQQFASCVDTSTGYHCHEHPVVGMAHALQFLVATAP